MDTPIRLLFVTHDLAIGGLQQVILNLCRNIDRSRFHVSVLCLRDLGPLTEQVEQLDIKVLLLPQKKQGTDYLSFLKVAKILRQENIQVIHTHNTQPLVDATLGALLSGRRQRIVHTDHARQFPDKKRYMFAEWCMSHFLFRMIGVSEQTTENLRKFEKISASKLLTIENGIDGSCFNRTIDIARKRKELGVSDSGPIIGVIARLEKIKGITYLLQAMPEILQRQPQTTLLIVGDGSEKSALEKECAQLKLGEHVVFTGSRSDIPEIFQVLDLYVLPSLSEGLPMGILEAMAAGCPIVASRVGGIPDVVAHGRTAMLVDPEDPAQLSDAICLLLGDARKLGEISRNLLGTFGEKYDAKTMVSRYMKLYAG